MIGHFFFVEEIADERSSRKASKVKEGRNPGHGTSKDSNEGPWNDSRFAEQYPREPPPFHVF